jgi:hypothetical protein
MLVGRFNNGLIVNILDGKHFKFIECIEKEDSVIMTFGYEYSGIWANGSSQILKLKFFKQNGDWVCEDMTAPYSMPSGGPTHLKKNRLELEIVSDIKQKMRDLKISEIIC